MTADPAPALLGPADGLPPRYEPVRRLGAGGGGDVWALRDRAGGAALALKVLSRDAGEAEIEALVREAVALSGLEGLGLPRIVAFGALRDGRRYMVRELVEGRSLDDLLQAEDAAPWAHALATACDQLTVVHRSGLLHGDVKPANIIVGEGGRGTLVDLGLAAPWREGGTAARGLTPKYAAPELFEGEPLTVRAEVFAPLGATLAEALARGGDALGHDVRIALAKVAARATEASASARWPSVDELASALRRAAKLPPAEPPGDPPWPVLGLDPPALALLARVKALPAGHAIGLRGPSGSGRSTLARRLAWTLGVEGRRVVLVDAPGSIDVELEGGAAEHGGLTLVVDDGEALDARARGAVGHAVARGARLVWVGDDLAGSRSEERSAGVPRPIARRAVLRGARAAVGPVAARRLARLRGPARRRAPRGAAGRRPPAGGARDRLEAGRRRRPGDVRAGRRSRPRAAVGEALGVAKASALIEILAGSIRPRSRSTTSARRARRPSACASVSHARASLSAAGTRPSPSPRLAAIEDAATGPTRARVARVARRARAGALSGRSVRRRGTARRRRGRQRRGPTRSRPTAALRARPRRGLHGRRCAGARHPRRGGARRAVRGRRADRGRVAGVRGHRAPARRPDRRGAGGVRGIARRGREGGRRGDRRHDAPEPRGPGAGRRRSRAGARPPRGRRRQGPARRQRRVRHAGAPQPREPRPLPRTLGARAWRRSSSSRPDGTSSPLPRAQLLGLEAEHAARTSDVARGARLYGATARGWQEQGREHDAVEARLEGLLGAGARGRGRRGGARRELRRRTRASHAKAGLGEHAALARGGSRPAPWRTSRAGDEEAARRALDGAIDLARKAGRREWAWQALDARARLAAAQGGVATARRDTEAALAMLEETAAKLPRDLREVF